MKKILLIVAFICHNAYAYKDFYKNIAKQTSQDIGIVIVAYNRPHYLEKLINSLETNHEAQILPFYFILEGGPNAKQHENTILIKNSSIKNKYIIKRERNYGLAKNLIDAKRFMFDYCGYKKIIFCEEDLTVSPYFIANLLNLHAWATKNYANIGAITTRSYCFLPKHLKEERLHWVTDAGPNLWWNLCCYCIDKKVWNDIKEFLYFYEKEFIDKIPLHNAAEKMRSKPGFWSGAFSIKQWIHTLAHNKFEGKIYPKYKLHGRKIYTTPELEAWQHEIFYKTPIEKREITQDSVTSFSLWLAGYIKLETVVNRANHIGVKGVTPRNEYSVKRLQAIQLDSFPQDKMLKEFRLVSRLEARTI